MMILYVHNGTVMVQFVFAVHSMPFSTNPHLSVKMSMIIVRHGMKLMEAVLHVLTDMELLREMV
jgi:hypothetical protein